MEFFQNLKRQYRSNLKISFKPFSEINSSSINAFAKWANDPKIRELTFPRRDEAHEYVTWTTESIKAKLESCEKNPSFLIFDHATAIGEINYRFNFPLLLNDSEKTAWLSITIGDSSYWGNGIGKKALSFLEKEARHAGAERVEVGVFEFNSLALKFYKKLGYREIGKIPQFVFYKEKMWSDIRLEKIF